MARNEITPHKRCEGEVYVLTRGEGGREVPCNGLRSVVREAARAVGVGVVVEVIQ